MRQAIIVGTLLLAVVSLASPFLAHAAPNPFNISIWNQSGNGGYDVGCNTSVAPCTFCDMVKVAANLAIALRNVALTGAVVFIIYGAGLLIVSAGSEERFKSGKSIVTNAIIGVAITLAAWLIVNEVILIISGSTPLPWNQITCS